MESLIFIDDRVLHFSRIFIHRIIYCAVQILRAFRYFVSMYIQKENVIVLNAASNMKKVIITQLQINLLVNDNLPVLQLLGAVISH